MHATVALRGGCAHRARPLRSPFCTANGKRRYWANRGATSPNPAVRRAHLGVGHARARDRERTTRTAFGGARRWRRRHRQVHADRGGRPTEANVDLYLGRCMHLGGDAIALAPLADLLRQIRRSAPECSTTRQVTALARWLKPDPSAAPSRTRGRLVRRVPRADRRTRGRGRARRRVRRPPLGRRRNVGSVRVLGQEPGRRARRARRHLPADETSRPPGSTASTRGAVAATHRAPDPPRRPRPRRRHGPRHRRLIGEPARRTSSSRSSPAARAIRSSPRSSSPRTSRAKRSRRCCPT